jgi:hypothetical protein
MERGLRREVGLYEDWCDTPVPHNTKYGATDIISFTIYTIDTNEVVMHWDNPKYNKQGEL